jgi:hypothetical protein
VSSDILANLAFALQSLIMTPSFRCSVCLCGLFCSRIPVRGLWFGFVCLFASLVVSVLFLSFFVFIIIFLAFLALFGIADARLSLPDLPADAWQLHNGCILDLLGPAWAALNSRSASAKVSSFTSTLCGYLRSNHSFVKDVKKDRRKKSVSDATV